MDSPVASLWSLRLRTLPTLSQSLVSPACCWQLHCQLLCQVFVFAHAGHSLLDAAQRPYVRLLAGSEDLAAEIVKTSVWSIAPSESGSPHTCSLRSGCTLVGSPSRCDIIFFGLVTMRQGRERGLFGAVILVLAMLTFLGSAYAAQYIVGGDVPKWNYLHATSKPSFYQDWADTIAFKTGDTLRRLSNCLHFYILCVCSCVCFLFFRKMNCFWCSVGQIDVIHVLDTLLFYRFFLQNQIFVLRYLSCFPGMTGPASFISWRILQSSERVSDIHCNSWIAV